MGLIIEIDGSSLDEKQDYDAIQQSYFEELGLNVYRILDINVKKNLYSVMLDLEEYIVANYSKMGRDSVQGQ